MLPITFNGFAPNCVQNWGELKGAKARGVTMPPDENQRSVTANTKIRIRANQKTGRE